MENKFELLDHMKEEILRKVQTLFQNSKSNLEISRRLNTLLDNEIPYILSEYGLQKEERSVTETLQYCLKPVYGLDENFDEKSFQFKNSLVNSLDNSVEEIVNAKGEDFRFILGNVSQRINDEYCERTEDMDKKVGRNEQEFSTYEPDFKREIRQELLSRGIQNEDMLNDIERRVKNIVGDIYFNYNTTDKNISFKLQEICDSEISQVIREVENKENEEKENIDEKLNSNFISSLKDGVNSDDELAKKDMDNKTNKDILKEIDDKPSLPSDILK